MSGILQRLADRSLRRAAPLKASLELTYRCNERCSHCYLDSFRDDPARRLTLDQWKHVLAELRGAGVLYVVLMGGEAMLHPHFWEIASETAHLGFVPSLITNGLKIDETAAGRFKDLGFAPVTVSLYSLSAEIHDRMTVRAGSHARLLEAVSHLSSAGVPVAVNCLLTRHNIEGYFELEAWCRELGFALQADAIVTPKFSGDPAPTRERASSEQLVQHYRKLAARDRRPHPEEPAPRDGVCGVGRAKCAVTAYGELLACIEVREPLGLLTERPFAELWAGEIAERWRALRISDLHGFPSKGGGDCDHCPGMARNESGDPKRVSPFVRELAEIRRTTRGDLP